jgi:Lipocalin-like domain
MGKMPVGAVGAVIEREEVMRKSSLQVAYLLSSLPITALLLNLAHAQTAKDLVGAWIAVSNVAEQGGVKSEPYGANPQGMLIFEADGRYGLILSRKDLPKFASNSRTNGTADENKSVVHGTIAHFGQYTVSPADKSIVFRIELSTYPNFNGTEQKRSFELVGDELKYTLPAFSGGGTAVAVWKRAK